MDRGFRLFLAVVGFCLGLQEVPAEPLKGSSQQSPAEVQLFGAAILSRGAGGVVLAQSKNRSATAPTASLPPPDSGGPDAKAVDARLGAERLPLRSLQWPDWLAIVLYATLVLGVGLYYSRLQTSTEEYFVASRNMRASVAGISLMATLLSAISYLATPGEMIKHGPAMLWQMGAYPIVFSWSATP